MLQALNLYPSKTWTRIGSRDQPFEPSFLKTNTATNRWTKQYNLKKASYKIFSESVSIVNYNHKKLKIA